MSEKNYKEKLGGLAAKLKSQPTNTPIQEVTPVNVQNPEEEKSQLNVWIPKSLKKEMKRREIDTDESLTAITTQALKQYLTQSK
jgi:hypothetical protein